jgi:general secretion pathway protein H
MPISAPGIFSRRGFTPPRKSGFTLIELLVVLLVMGLLAGLVGVIVHPDERTLLRTEAERLAQLLDLAAVESRMTGNPIAWTATLAPEGAQYGFSRRRNDEGWSEATEDALRPRRLPPGMSISDLRIEGAAPAAGLRIEFSPGDSLAYDFQMSLGAARYAIGGSPVGQVRVHAPQ